MIQFSSARIGTSEAAKRVDRAALAFQRQRAAEAERRRAEAAAQAAQPAPPTRVESPRRWAEKQIAAWAALQPHIRLTVKPRWRSILEEVAEVHGVTVDDLTGDSRLHVFVLPRQEAMFRMFDETPMSFLEIGRRLNRDHTTALHGVRAHAARHGLPLPRQDDGEPS